MADKQVVAIAGASDTAKYLVEELEKTSRYSIVLITRAERPWFNRPSMTQHITDYTESSLLSILNTTHATILFSFLHSNDPSFYNTAHLAMLRACSLSSDCTRFVPSEYGGDLINHPDKPRFYIPTHGALRRALRKHKQLQSKNGEKEVEWTLMCMGWFMDYFVETEKRYYKDMPDGFWPLDTKNWRAVIPGTGKERIGWTAGRDVAKALVRLIEVPRGEWPEETYVMGTEGTWNEALGWVEKFHGRKFESVEYRTPAQIYREIADCYAEPEEQVTLARAYMDEWNFSGASALPNDVVQKQRETLFEGIRFATVEELLETGRREGHV